MKHRLLRYAAGWQWHLLLESPDNDKDEMKRALPDCARWLDEIDGRASNHISAFEQGGGEAVLHGTLMFQLSEDDKDIQPLHFWVSNQRLVTVHSDLRLSLRLQRMPWEDMLERCTHAPEAFYVIQCAILETYHAGLDTFEQRLGTLEDAMRNHNQTNLLEAIFERRYDLLHWNHLFIPIREIENAAREAFIQQVEQSETFQRLVYKLNRIETLLDHYSNEIDTLISMDDAIANFRGNDIMKTLTIFTALFTPATVLGALWGMNYLLIPGAVEPWGFPIMCGIILLFTALIYLWLWHKGWTGDLLRFGKKVRSEPTSNKGARNKHPRHKSTTDEPPLSRSQRHRR
ncbi:magnesium transporter [Paenibacillaceae bacterium]|nr:magnesium transporter [Paenibacillaceae bacterium]